MTLVGCDLHTRKQQVAVLDTETGETHERQLVHEGSAVEEFYAALPRPVTVGIESTGYAIWFHAVLRQNSVRHQGIDLAGLIQRKFRLDGHPPAPPASTASPPLRRSPPCRPGEPGLAPPARRLQEDGDSAEGAQERPPLLGRAVEGVGGLEAGSRHRVAQHGPAVAAPPLPRVLGHTLRPAHRGPPTRQC